MSNKVAPGEDADRKRGGNIHNKAEKLKSIFKVSCTTLFEQVASRLRRAVCPRAQRDE